MFCGAIIRQATVTRDPGSAGPEPSDRSLLDEGDGGCGTRQPLRWLWKAIHQTHRGRVGGVSGFGDSCATEDGEP